MCEQFPGPTAATRSDIYLWAQGLLQSRQGEQGGRGLPSSCSLLPSPPSKRPKGKRSEVACRCSGTQQTPEVLRGLRCPNLHMMPPRCSHLLGAKEKGGVEGAFTKCLLGARCAPKPVGLRLTLVGGPQTQGWACRALPSSGLCHWQSELCRQNLSGNQ